MKTYQRIPESAVALIDLGQKARLGAAALGATSGLLHHTATTIGTDLYAVIGDPAAAAASPARLGKLGFYRNVVSAGASARNALDGAMNAGREHARIAAGTLKGSLGWTWNDRWRDAGFTRSILAIPKDAVPALMEMRAYLLRNPGSESTDLQVTAAHTDAMIAAIHTAQHNDAVASAARLEAAQDRDGALAALRRRLIGLRGELKDLLDPESADWYQFGLRRPIDGRLPDPIDELTLSTSGPGTIIARWDESSRVLNYRVAWKPATPTGTVTEIGLVNDPIAVITGLPGGTAITVIVTARNQSGETLPATADAVVS